MIMHSCLRKAEGLSSYATEPSRKVVKSFITCATNFAATF